MTTKSKTIKKTSWPKPRPSQGSSSSISSAGSCRAKTRYTFVAPPKSCPQEVDITFEGHVDTDAQTGQQQYTQQVASTQFYGGEPSGQAHQQTWPGRHQVPNPMQENTFFPGHHGSSGPSTGHIPQWPAYQHAGTAPLPVYGGTHHGYVGHPGFQGGGTSTSWCPSRLHPAKWQSRRGTAILRCSLRPLPAPWPPRKGTVTSLSRPHRYIECKKLFQS